MQEIINEPFKFLSKISIGLSTECWSFTGAKVKGYGKFSTWDKVKNKNYLAHRVSFSIFNGELIEGLVVDHVCRNRSCVSPEHLRQVTVEENVFENSDTLTLKNRDKTHCSRGHEFSGHNLLLIGYKGRKHRRCRACTYEMKKINQRKGDMVK